LTTKKIGKKVKSLTYISYLVPIAVILLAYLFLVVATGESQPLTIVSGPSMQPTILPGTVVVVAKTPFDQLTAGDIIVFTPIAALQDPSTCQSTAPGSLTQDAFSPCSVIHRIVLISNDSNGQRIVITSGDNNGPSGDSCSPAAPRSIQGYDCDINQSMYYGEVIAQFPLLGYAIQPPYRYYFAALILFFVIIELYASRKRPSKS
jgi:signal peptidase I